MPLVLSETVESGEAGIDSPAIAAAVTDELGAKIAEAKKSDEWRRGAVANNPDRLFVKWPNREPSVKNHPGMET